MPENKQFVSLVDRKSLFFEKGLARAAFLDLTVKLWQCATWSDPQKTGARQTFFEK